MRRAAMIHLPLLVTMLSCAAPAAPKRTAQLFAVSFGSQYTDDDFRRMGEKLDLVILDPLNFPRVPSVLKQVNPNIKALGYCNTFDIRDMSSFVGRALTPGGKTERMIREWQEADAKDWFYHDEQGRRVNVYLNKRDDRYGLDIGRPDVRAFLAAKSKAIVDGGYDGVFLDNVGVRYPYGYGIGGWVSAVPEGLTERKWWDDSILMLRAIKEAVGDKLVVFNQVRGYNPEVSLEFVAETDGAMDETWLSDGNFKPQQWREDVSLVQRLNKLNTYTLPIAQGASEQAAKALFASYLLAKDGEHAYFAYGPYNFTQWKWFAFYDVDLGDALGDYTHEGNVYSRRYERGMVLVNIADSPATVTLPAEYQTGLAERVRSVRLPGRSGELLYTLDVRIRLPRTIRRDYLGEAAVDFSEPGPAAAKSITLMLDVEPTKASSAALLLTLFDADNPAEGEIVINGKQTIPLPWGKGPAYNWKNVTFEAIAIDTAALAQGRNTITVRRNEGGTFKVSELTVRLMIPREALGP